MTNSSLYGEDEDQAASAAPDEGQQAAGDDQEPKDVQGKTFLVEKAMLPPDAKPGDRWEMEVVQVHDQEAECRVAEPKEDEGAQEAAGEPNPAPDEASGPGGMYG